MRIIMIAAAGAALIACSPTVRLAGGDKPIEINLNINARISQEVLVKMEEDVKKAIAANPNIF